MNVVFHKTDNILTLVIHLTVYITVRDGPASAKLQLILPVNCKVYIRTLQFYTSKFYTYHSPIKIIKCYLFDS